MNAPMENQCTAFEGARRIASGALAEVAAKAKKVVDRGPRAPILIFDDTTSELIEVDFRGTAAELLKRLGRPSWDAPADATDDRQVPQRGPGRPKLGVVAREVTLLPRQWDWLSGQPGGASVALRKLVDEARRVHEGRDRIRRSREATYRFMSVMAGDRPGFEEATRALFAGNRAGFDALVARWPVGVRDHVGKLAAVAFGKEPIPKAPHSA